MRQQGGRNGFHVSEGVGNSFEARDPLKENKRRSGQEGGGESSKSMTHIKELKHALLLTNGIYFKRI
jgi:hypothetical protein